VTIYAATGNAGKLREFAESASGEGIEVLALPGLSDMPEPVEDAETFMGNAELKAIAYSKLAPGKLVFADDSGIAIDALDGRPLPEATSREAKFVCTLALARDGEVLLLADGDVAGEMLQEPRGSGGFGYDPLFLIPSLGVTMAEIPREQKWTVSHRGNAFRKLLQRVQVEKL
jgi:XTP/dITP diphosphohydrolase